MLTMGPTDLTDIFDLIWSDVDNRYIAFPRNHTEGRFIKEFPHLMSGSSLAGSNAIGLPDSVTDAIKEALGDNAKWIDCFYAAMQGVQGASYERIIEVANQLYEEKKINK